VEWGGHAVHYIYDSSLSWLDTITSIESYLCLSGMRWSCSALYIWQLNSLAWYKNFSRKFQTYALVEWGGHAVHYICDRSLSWLDTRTSVESSLCLSRMRWSCSALYIWQLTILAWYKNFSRKFQTHALVEWGGHVVHYISDSSLSWLDTITSVESSPCLSGMRWSCSVLYIWLLTILAWYNNFSRKFPIS
jgi:endonuclease/exonuclease/phosphatase (EEP) superfamily protein YafD